MADQSTRIDLDCHSHVTRIHDMPELEVICANNSSLISVQRCPKLIYLEASNTPIEIVEDVDNLETLIVDGCHSLYYIGESRDKLIELSCIDTPLVTLPYAPLKYLQCNLEMINAYRDSSGTVRSPCLGIHACLETDQTNILRSYRYYACNKDLPFFRRKSYKNPYSACTPQSS